MNEVEQQSSALSELCDRVRPMLKNDPALLKAFAGQMGAWAKGPDEDGTATESRMLEIIAKAKPLTSKGEALERYAAYPVKTFISYDGFADPHPYYESYETAELMDAVPVRILIDPTTRFDDVLFLLRNLQESIVGSLKSYQNRIAARGSNAVEFDDLHLPF